MKILDSVRVSRCQRPLEGKHQDNIGGKRKRNPEEDAEDAEDAEYLEKTLQKIVVAGKRRNQRFSKYPHS